MSRSKDPSRSERGRSRDAASAPEHAASGADRVFAAGAWTLRFHPLFLDQMERVVSAAEREAAARAPGDPEGPNMKLADAVRRIMFSEVPEDPSRPKYRHGGTLGRQFKHWLRAKFGNGRFRLFFRYRRDAALIVYAWVNDSTTLRAYGSKHERIPMEVVDNRARRALGYDLETVLSEEAEIDRGNYVLASDFFDGLRAETLAADAGGHHPLHP